MKFILALLALTPLVANAGSWQHAVQVGTEVATILGEDTPNFIPAPNLGTAMGQAVPVGGKCNIKLDRMVFLSDNDDFIAYIISHEMGHCNEVAFAPRRAQKVKGEALRAVWDSEYGGDSYAMRVASRFNIVEGARYALGDTPDTQGHPSAQRRLEAMTGGSFTYPDVPLDQLDR